MKQNKLLWNAFLTVIGFLLMACGKSGEDTAAEIIQEDLFHFAQDTLVLEKDEFTKNLYGNFTYVDTGDTPLLLQYQGYELLVYSYHTGKLQRRQVFEREGPDGIGTFVSGHLITQDKVYFLANGKNLVVADQQGKVLERVKLPVPVDERRGTANYSTFASNPMYLEGEQLFIKDFPFVLKERLLDYHNWILQLDLHSHSTSYIPFEWPGKYKDFLDDSEFSQYSHLYLPEKQLHLVSFSANDSLLAIDEEGKKRWVDGASNHSMEFLRGETKEDGGYIMFLPNHESSRYGALQFDPWTELVIRSVLKKRNSGGVQQKSFVIMNHNLEKIAELDFQSDEVSAQGFFTPDGFFLPLSGKRQASDDEVQFIRFNLPTF